MNASNTKTIARNTAWYGFENAISFVVGLSTSIAIARTLGPSKMGYIIYVIWIASVVSNLGGMGIPATTRKYMAEFLGGGDRGTARFIYFRTLQLQAVLATLATAGLLIWVLRDAAGEYKVASALIVLSIWPAMVNFISAQANVATEELSTNLPASVVSTIVFFIAVAATVILKWGVIGFGASMLAMRLADFLVRIFPTVRRILAWETTHFFPDGLRQRMTAFAWQSVTSMIVALIVWDRSEFFLLKYLCPDIRQVSYYSVAFGLAERLLISSVIFGSATGATIFAQYGRDKSRLSELAVSSFRYLALTTIPVHFIFTALAVPALAVLYGPRYSGAAAVVTLAPLLCMPKAFIGPIQSLLQSTERQSYVITATILAGIVDISVAWALIPAHGAVGACIGSGTAQVVAVGLMWGVGMHLYKFRLPWLLVAKIALSSILAALTAHFIAVRLAAPLAILFGGSSALIVLFLLFSAMRVLEPEDYSRFRILIGMLPKPLVKSAGNFLSLLMFPGSTSIVGENIVQTTAVSAAEWAHAGGTREEAVQAPPFAIGDRLAASRAVRVSVVIPAYNAAPFLPRCLQSVFAQTLKPEEVIVVDDGSTDNTAALAAELGATVIRRPNGGISAARNTGIQQATSEWIALLDADDLWAPEKLERQVACIRPETVLVYTGIQIFDDRDVRGDQPAIDADSAVKMLRYRNPITPSSALVNRQVVLQIGGFLEGIDGCEDWEMWLRLQHAGQFEAVSDVLTSYYVYANSFSADPEKMLKAMHGIIDTRLVADLQGLDRWVWRRRILAAQLCSAGLIARDNKLKGEFSYLFQSLCAWPSPWWDSRRFAIFATSARNVFRRPEQVL